MWRSSKPRPAVLNVGAADRAAMGPDKEMVRDAVSRALEELSPKGIAWSSLDGVRRRR